MKKKLRNALIVIAAFILLTATAFAYTVPDNTTVYVTNYGEKYHRDGCPYLKSINALTIKDAVAGGYGPCSLCHPDYLTGKYQPGVREYLRSHEGQRTVGGVAAVAAAVTGAGIFISKKKNKNLPEETYAVSEYDRLNYLYGGRTRSEIAQLCGKPDWVVIGANGEPTEVQYINDDWYQEYKRVLSDCYALGVPVLADPPTVNA